MAVQRREWSVQHEKVGALQKRPCERQLLLLTARKPLGARSDVEIEADLEDQFRQAGLAQRLDENRVDAAGRFRIAGHDTAEEDVVLNRCGGIDRIGPMDRDRLADAAERSGFRILQEAGAGRKDVVADVVAEEPEAMARFHIAEGETLECPAVFSDTVPSIAARRRAAR